MALLSGLSSLGDESEQLIQRRTADDVDRLDSRLEVVSSLAGRLVGGLVVAIYSHAHWLETLLA